MGVGFFFGVGPFQGQELIGGCSGSAAGRRAGSHLGQRGFRAKGNGCGYVAVDAGPWAKGNFFLWSALPGQEMID